MRFEITGSVDPLLSVTLEKGEKVLAESNAMVAMDGDLSLKGRSRGGIMKSLARKLLNDESFFQQYVEAEKGPGSVLLAPNIPGDIRILDVGERQYMVSDGAFLAATEEVELEVKSQGLGRAFLGDSGGFFVMATDGRGQIAVSGFGSVRELEVKEGQSLIDPPGRRPGEIRQSPVRRDDQRRQLPERLLFRRGDQACGNRGGGHRTGRHPIASDTPCQTESY